MNYTQNYQLNQWVASDRVLMEDFNADNQKIEAALNKIPHIAAGTYFGTGEFSSDHPNSLAFAFKPTMVLISEPLGQFNNFTALPAVPNMTTIYTVGSYYLTLKWEGNTIYWWSAKNEQEQFNQLNRIYYYIAI